MHDKEGVGTAELSVGGSAGAAAVADEYSRARKSHESNPVRKAKALAISGGPSGTPQMLQPASIALFATQ